MLLTKFLDIRRWWGIFSKSPDQKPLFLLQIKLKNKTQVAQISSIMQSSNTFIRISGPTPEVQKDLHWPMIGKILHIGKNLNKARCWRKSLVCPKHLGGVTMLGKYCNFSPFSNLETVFPALKLTRNCYLKWTFRFHENWQFNHKLGPSLYSTNTVPANKIWNQWDFKNPNFIYNSLVNREKSRSVDTDKIPSHKEMMEYFQ